MRLTSLKLKGFSSAFPGVVDLPLRDIEPGLVAVVGPNGQGKTTLLEATPAAIYRQLPARNGMPAVDFAVSRESYIDLEYVFGSWAFRSRVNFDSQTRKTDAVLEAIQADGSRVPLSDGKVSTYKTAIESRFPSFDLFLNSSFAAQGRGDEFTRSSPTKRKDLFVEFLVLKRLLAMSAAAGEAAALCGDAHLRLTVQAETLERDTAPEHFRTLEQWAAETQGKVERAEVRQRELATAIADLEARATLAGDASTAYAAAQLRVSGLVADLTTRRAELTALRLSRNTASSKVAEELTAIQARRDMQIRDVDVRLQGNTQIQAQAEAIRAAVDALATIDADLARLRETERADQGLRDTSTKDLAAAEYSVSSYAVSQRDLARVKTDSALLSTVPCGGAGEYATCQFLVNATAAQARIAELETQVAGVTGAIQQRDTVKAQAQRLDERLTTTRTLIAAAEGNRSTHEKTAKYATALAEADARVAELQTKRTEVLAEATRQAEAAQERLHVRILEFDAQDLALQDVIDQLTRDYRAAQQDLEAAAAGNTQATELLSALTAARAERDLVVRTLGEVQGSQLELARRRDTLKEKAQRAGDVRRRIARVETELLEWRDLQKALGKGGLPDLEIDAAGPTISALTNDLLLATYGARFSLELVTQVEKADGSGMKDEFTVRVLDNEDYGGWRDLSELSGGEKVVVQEALMLAISVYVNERSPHPIRTLWRDETGAALDPENTIRYVQMLRKARELGGFHHVFFISHNPAAAALADTQIHVGGGQARIVQAPFEAAA